MGHSTSKQRTLHMQIQLIRIARAFTHTHTCSFVVTCPRWADTAHYSAIDVKWRLDSLIFNMIHLIEWVLLEFRWNLLMKFIFGIRSINVNISHEPITIKSKHSICFWSDWKAQFGQVRKTILLVLTQLQIILNTLIQLHAIKLTNDLIIYC